LRLTTAQFEELEGFARFGTELDADTRRRLARGHRVRAILGQPPFDTLPVSAQVLTLWAVGSGAFDALPVAAVPAQAAALRAAAALEFPDVLARWAEGAALGEADEAAFAALCARVVRRDGDA
jgi:F-type H+/Na+-transporting ATPase subunit alpha